MSALDAERASRLEQMSKQYKGYVMRGRVGWHYRITGQGIGLYEGGLGGIPRRTEQAALDAMGRRVARLRRRGERFAARRKVTL